MISSFFKDSLIYSFSNFILKGISFILLPFYTRVLTPSDYGVIDLLATLFSLLSVTICLEITQAVGRYLPEFNEKKVIKLTIARTGLWFSIVMNFLFMLIFLGFSKNISSLIFGNESFQILVRLTGVNLLVYGSLYAVQNQIRWQLMAKQNALIAIITSLITISSTIFLVLYFRLSVEGVLLGQIIGHTAGLFFSFFFIKETLLPVINFKYLKRMLWYSFPLVFASTGFILSQYVDRILLNCFLGVEDVGLYGVAFRIANTVSLVLAGFSATVTPLIMNNYKKEDATKQISKIFGYFFFFSLFLIILISFFSDLIFTYFISSVYENAIYVMPYILFSVLFNGAYIFAPGLSLSGKTKQITYINILAVCANILFSIVLLNLIGYIGAGIASFLASGFFIFIMFLRSNKYYKIPYPFRNIVLVLAVSVILCILIQYLNVTMLIEVFVKLLLIFLFVICCFYMKIISIHDFNSLKKRVFLRIGLTSN